MRMIAIIAIIPGIHIGLSTQIHDQDITFNNLRTINAIVSAPQKPIPALLVLFVSFILPPQQ